MDVGQLVRLRPMQCYAGCLGVVVAAIPRGHHATQSFEVYLDDFGTVVRGAADLEPVSDADLADPRFQFSTPQEWLLQTEAKASRAALLQAVRNNNHGAAVKYASMAAEAELRLEEVQSEAQAA